MGSGFSMNCVLFVQGQLCIGNPLNMRPFAASKILIALPTTWPDMQAFFLRVSFSARHALCYDVRCEVSEMAIPKAISPKPNMLPKPYATGPESNTSPQLPTRTPEPWP